MSSLLTVIPRTLALSSLHHYFFITISFLFPSLVSLSSFYSLPRYLLSFFSVPRLPFPSCLAFMFPSSLFKPFQYPNLSYLISFPPYLDSSFPSHSSSCLSQVYHVVFTFLFFFLYTRPLSLLSFLLISTLFHAFHCFMSGFSYLHFSPSFNSMFFYPILFIIPSLSSFIPYAFPFPPFSCVSHHQPPFS